MKTAITIWNDRVSPVFDVTGKARLYESEGERICSEQQLLLPDACATEKIACLVEAGTDVLICGAISRDAHSTATNAGIRVFRLLPEMFRRFFRPAWPAGLLKAVLRCRGAPAEWLVTEGANMAGEDSR